MPAARVNDIRISYQVRGKGPPVLLIAGFASGGNVWDLLADELSTDHTCIAFDNRGVGDTSAPRQAYRISQMADDAEGLLATVGLTLEETRVVGQSMGGFIALDLATRGRSPAALVLVATAAKGGSPVAGMSPRARSALYRTSGPRREIVRGIAEAGMGARTRLHHPERVAILEQKLLSSTLKAPGYLGQGAAVAAFDGTDRLREIACPCSVVHGTADEMIPFAAAEALAAAIPGATLLPLEGVGHFPQIEAVLPLADEIRRLGRTIAGGQAS